VRIATMVNPGDFRSIRTANFTSCIRIAIAFSDVVSFSFPALGPNFSGIL
jgi:hypothetical protein